MSETVHCVSLRTVKYSDNTSIVTVWTRERGRMSVSVPAGSTREAARRRAIMMPLGAFEAVAHLRPGREIARLSDVRPLGGGASTANPARGVVAMFLADFLYAVLRDSAPDELLTDYLMQSIEQLHRAQGAALANFHLWFLYRLTRYLGIEPDLGTWAPGRWLDMREGLFTASAPLHAQRLAPSEAAMVPTLARLTERTLGRLRLTRDERNRALDALLEYYSIHYQRVQSLPSLAVAREIFA